MSFQIYLGIILLISTITVGLTWWWTIKFLRIFRFKKKLQLIFLFTVWLSAIGRVVYFIMEFIWRQGKCSESPSLCSEAPIYWLSSTLFSIAVVINIFNWRYQTIRMKKFREGKRQNQMHIHILFGVFTFIVFISYTGFTLSACYFGKQDDLTFLIFSLIYSGTFLLLGISFVAVGINFYLKFRQVWEDKAKKIKVRIFLSITIISVTFIIRGVLNITSAAFDKNF